MTYFQLFLMIVSAIITVAMQPKPQDAKATAFADIDFPQSEEGTAQCVFFGDCWSGDWMVLAVGDYRVEAIKADDSGKK